MIYFRSEKFNIELISYVSCISTAMKEIKNFISGDESTSSTCMNWNKKKELQIESRYPNESCIIVWSAFWGRGFKFWQYLSSSFVNS